jgi:hypothetical protein
VRESLWLVKGGIPFDLAFSLDEVTRAAFCIVLSEMEGSKFDWHRMDFEDPK